MVASLAAAGELLRGLNPVHLKGFGDGMSPVYFHDALALIIPHNAVVWDGDPLKAGGFTALVELYLAANPAGIGVVFKPRDAVDSVLGSWGGVMQRYPGRITVVPVDIPTDTDALGLHNEVIKSCAALPGWARDYYALGRAAIKVSGATVVVSLGGGGIAAREVQVGIEEGTVSWTVFAASRGQKESHTTLCDVAAANPGAVTLVRGKDPTEALAFSSRGETTSSPCGKGKGNATRTRQCEVTGKGKGGGRRGAGRRDRERGGSSSEASTVLLLALCPRCCRHLPPVLPPPTPRAASIHPPHTCHSRRASTRTT